MNANLHEGTSGGPVIIPRTVYSMIDHVHLHTLLGIHSGEYIADGRRLGLNIVWYPRIIYETVTSSIRGKIFNLRD